MRKQRISVLSIVLLSILTFANAADADESQEREGIWADSLTLKLAGERHELLSAESTHGSLDSALQDIVHVLANCGQPRISFLNAVGWSFDDAGATLEDADATWSLRVDGDGSSFSYRGNLDDEVAFTLAGETTGIDDSTIRAEAENFINGFILPLIPLGPDEEIVFLGTEAYGYTFLDPLSGRQWDEEIAAIAVFGRRVGSVPVVGPGSRVSIWLAGNLEVVAIDVDWPRLTGNGNFVYVMDRDDVWLRAEKLTGISSADLENNLRLSRANGIRMMECGYVDLGVALRQGAPIQPGCLIYHDGVSPDGQPIHATYEIPIGDKVEEDCSWPAVSAVSGMPWIPCGPAVYLAEDLIFGD